MCLLPAKRRQIAFNSHDNDDAPRTELLQRPVLIWGGPWTQILSAWCRDAGSRSVRKDRQAEAVLTSVFPERYVIMIHAIPIDFGGGGTTAQPGRNREEISVHVVVYLLSHILNSPKKYILCHTCGAYGPVQVHDLWICLSAGNRGS